MAVKIRHAVLYFKIRSAVCRNHGKHCAVVLAVVQAPYAVIGIVAGNGHLTHGVKGPFAVFAHLVEPVGLIARTGTQILVEEGNLIVSHLSEAHLKRYCKIQLSAEGCIVCLRLHIPILRIGERARLRIIAQRLQNAALSSAVAVRRHQRKGSARMENVAHGLHCRSGGAGLIEPCFTRRGNVGYIDAVLLLELLPALFYFACAAASVVKHPIVLIIVVPYENTVGLARLDRGFLGRSLRLRRRRRSRRIRGLRRSTARKHNSRNCQYYCRNSEFHLFLLLVLNVFLSRLYRIFHAGKMHNPTLGLHYINQKARHSAVYRQKSLQGLFCACPRFSCTSAGFAFQGTIFAGI